MFFKRQQRSNQPVTLGEIPEGCRLLTAEELQCVSGGTEKLKTIKKSYSVSTSSNGEVCVKMTYVPAITARVFNYILHSTAVTNKLCVENNPSDPITSGELAKLIDVAEAAGFAFVAATGTSIIIEL